MSEQEREESTPTTFALQNPAKKDPQWPHRLATVATRIVSTARVVPTDTTSLLSANGEQDNTPLSIEQQPVRSIAGILNSQNYPLENRDNHQPQLIIRESDRDETSSEHFPGDMEMPPGLTQESANPISTQSPDTMALQPAVTEPPSAQLAHCSAPPDEDVMPKPVADSERINSNPPHYLFNQALYLQPPHR